MTLDEALAVAKWNRVTAPHMATGCYVVWSVEYDSFRRYWPTGDACTFVPGPLDRDAEWAKAW